MRPRTAPVALCLLAFLVVPRAGADIIVFGTHADHPLVPGASLTDARLSMTLSVEAGVATVGFTNVSVASALDGVIKEIVIDTHDADTNQWILWNPEVITDEEGVGFTVGDSNGLPGYLVNTIEPVPLVEFQAKPPPTGKGLSVGETLAVRFATSLPDGADTDAFEAFLAGGTDSVTWSLGFHAISVGTVDGESLSGIHTPEPASLVLVATGGCLCVLRRRR